LNIAQQSEDLNLPGYGLHQLGGVLNGFYSIRVNRNWRIISQFDSHNVTDVQLLDYH